MNTTPIRPAVLYSGVNPPATLRAWCDAHPERVQELHTGGGYSTERSGGFAYDILLRPGWCMSDDNCHTLIEPTVKAMLSQLRAIAQCDCQDCKEALAKGAGTW